MSKTSISLGTTGILAYLALIIAFIYGWIVNIIQIAHTDFSGGLSGEIILRVVGIFVAPLGAVMGYI